MKKSILIICQHFAPYTPSVGGVARVAYLAKFLVSKGYRVHILTSDGLNYGDLGFSSIINEIEITYLKDPIKWSIQKSLNVAKNTLQKEKKGLFMGILRHAKNLISRVIIPDLGIFMIYKYYKAASAIIQKDFYNTVIVSTPPHSMQIVGGLIKKRFGNGITLVSDYRDSWNASSIFSPSGKFLKYISLALERFVLKKSDLVTYVSNPMLSKMQKIFPELSLADKEILVMNGFAGKPSNFSARNNNNDQIDIGYFGMADDNESSYRNVRPLLECINKAVLEGKKITLHFYGTLRLTKINIANYSFVKIYENIPHDKIITCMQKMDFLLILHTDPKNSDEVITGKFFDYVQARRPIICFSPKNMEAVNIIKKYNFGIWVDCLNIKDAVESFKNLASTPYTIFNDDQTISNFSRDGQYQKLLDRLISIHHK